MAEVWLAEATAIVSVLDVSSKVHAGWANFWGANATAPLLAPKLVCSALLRLANALAAVSVVDKSQAIQGTVHIVAFIVASG